MKVYLPIIFALTLPFTAFSATIIVPDDYAKIQDAINASVNGDTIRVRAGTYYENIIFNGKEIVVQSFEGPGVTIIDGGQLDSVVRIIDSEGPDTILDGFTVTNGLADFGGGIQATSFARFSNNIIKNNGARKSGGGFGGNYYTGTIHNCIVHDNWAGSTGGGLSFVLGVPRLTNCIIYFNEADYGGGINAGGYTVPEVNHCTVCGNRAFINGGGGNMGGTSVSNSIFWYNIAPSNPQLAGFATNYCCVEGGVVGGTGNIDEIPDFVNPAKGDFHLTHDSPCRNSGNNLYSYPEHDMEGDPRISDGFADIGADEFHRHFYWVGDAVPGGTVQGKIVGDPGTAQVGMWLGSGVLDPPMSTPFGLWYLDFPILGFFILSPIPANGIEALPAFVLPGSIPAPYDLPLQAIVGNELTNLCRIPVR